MSRLPIKFTAEEVVDQVVANARLAGRALPDETVEVVRKLASGEMTREQSAEWRRQMVERYRKQI